MNIEPMSEGLVRQRRNLLSASLVLVFLKFAGVEVSKLSFLGLEFGKFGNPSALYLVVWVAFFYFLFRYYQYFSQEGKERLSRYYYEELERNVMIRVREMANSINPNSSFHPDNLALLKRGGWNIRVTYNGGKDDAGERKVEVVNITFPANELIRYKAVSIYNIVLHTSSATDYLLPFLIFFGALIYNICGAPSSLYEIFIGGFS